MKQALYFLRDLFRASPMLVVLNEGGRYLTVTVIKWRYLRMWVCGHALTMGKP